MVRGEKFSEKVSNSAAEAIGICFFRVLCLWAIDGEGTVGELTMAPFWRDGLLERFGMEGED